MRFGVNILQGWASVQKSGLILIWADQLSYLGVFEFFMKTETDLMIREKVGEYWRITDINKIFTSKILQTFSPWSTRLRFWPSIREILRKLLKTSDLLIHYHSHTHIHPLTHIRTYTSLKNSETYTFTHILFVSYRFTTQYNDTYTRARSVISSNAQTKQ